MTVGIDNHSDTSRDGRSTNPNNVSIGLHLLLADADCVGFGVGSEPAYVNVITPGGEKGTGGNANSDVTAAGGVISERAQTIGRVVAAGCVFKERLIPVGRVVDAGCVAI